MITSPWLPHTRDSQGSDRPEVAESWYKATETHEGLRILPLPRIPQLASSERGASINSRTEKTKNLAFKDGTQFESCKVLKEMRAVQNWRPASVGRTQSYVQHPMSCGASTPQIVWRTVALTHSFGGTRKLKQQELTDQAKQKTVWRMDAQQNVDG